MSRNDVAIKVYSSSQYLSSNAAANMDELNFDLMLDDDVRECIRLNNLVSELNVKQHKRVLDNDPTPLSELYEAS